MREVHNLTTLKHPNITDFKEYKNIENRIDIIQEYCDRGDLKDRLKDLKFGNSLNEKDLEKKYEIVKENIEKHIGEMAKRNS